VTFAEKALQPAKVSRVSIVDSHEKHLEVIVDDTQLSLAIGKKGQNVRLAAKLLGWKIDIKSEEEKRQEVEQQMNSLVGNSATSLENIAAELGDPVLQKLTEAGITSVESLADMTPEELEAIPGIDAETVEKISVAVNNYFSILDAAEQERSGQAAGETEAEAEVVEVSGEAGEVDEPKAALAGEQIEQVVDATPDSGEDAGSQEADASGASDDTQGEQPGSQDASPADK
jgi:N utilization substance protein A